MRKIRTATRTTLMAAGILCALPAAAQFGPIHMAVNRHEHVGHCPVEIVYTASINFEMPHPKGFVFNYHWERSDGAKGPSHVVRPGPHERTLVVREKWRVGGGRGVHDLSQTIHVNSGNTHLQESSPVVHVECR
ncbi:MAG: hypothetical protein ACXWBZ_18945 [Usitatibacter sp.]